MGQILLTRFQMVLGHFWNFLFFLILCWFFIKKLWFLKSTTFLCKEMGIASLLQKVFLKNSQNSPHFEKISNIFAVLTRKCHYIMKTDLSPPISMSIKARGGSGVILAYFVHMKVLFIVELLLFTEWISCRVNKLLRFEGRPLDVFSIQIYRGNLTKIWCFLSIFFYFLTLYALKLF